MKNIQRKIGIMLKRNLRLIIHCMLNILIIIYTLMLKASTTNLLESIQNQDGWGWYFAHSFFMIFTFVGLISLIFAGYLAGGFKVDNPWKSIKYRFDQRVARSETDIKWESYKSIGGSKDLYLKWMGKGFDLEEDDLAGLLATIGYIKGIINWGSLSQEDRVKIIKLRLREQKIIK